MKQGYIDRFAAKVAVDQTTTKVMQKDGQSKMLAMPTGDPGKRADAIANQIDALNRQNTIPNPSPNPDDPSHKIGAASMQKM